MKEFIEKLIGRLEEEVKSTREMQTIQCKGNDGYGTPLQAKLSGEICALLKAKNIVNQLAEEYNNDFCEWKIDGVYMRSPHDKVFVSCLDEETYRYNYCPVCGKRIKAVEPEGE